MPRMSKEEREVRTRYPHLSDYGVRQAIRPTEYFVQWWDDVLYEKELARVGGDRDRIDHWNTISTRDAKTLAAARRIGREVLRKHPNSDPAIYRRIGIVEERDVHEGLIIPSWTSEDDEWIEDVSLDEDEKETKA